MSAAEIGAVRPTLLRMHAIALGTQPEAVVRPRLRGWSHLVAFVAAIVLCPLLIVFSPGLRLPAALYAGAVIGLFGISGAYHVVFWDTRAHGVFRRLDHAMIFVLIAATYTPIVVSSLPGRVGAALLAIVWAGAVLGALMQLFLPQPPRAVTVGLYLLIGWAIAPVMHLMWGRVGLAGVMLIATGGLLHTLGAVVYAREHPNPFPTWFGFHEIFHLFVVAAIASHYVVIAFIVSPMV